MTRRGAPRRYDATPSPREHGESERALLPDGGRAPDDEADQTADDADGESDATGDGGTGGEDVAGADASNVEITEAGEADPADPKWETPDLDDIPDVDGPKTRPAKSSEAGGASTGERDDADGSSSQDGASSPAGAGGTRSDDPTVGMPNTARSPGRSRLKEEGTDGYVVALELCARLPDDVRLPDEAADLVPVALEAELEQDVQSFAAEAFDNPTPHVETLDFVDVDDELWLRLRLGVDPESFADLDPEEIRDHALQRLDGLL